MRKIIAMLLLVGMTVSARADVIPLPDDLPTITALISLHKKMKKAEDNAAEKVTVSYGTQTEATKETNTFYVARSTLDSKLNNAYSYVVLAGALSSTTTSLYRLIEEYTTLTKAASKTIFKKPMCTWYYMEANYALAKEVKSLKVLVASLTASGTNVLRSSMEEKLTLTFQIKASIEKMRSIIDRTYWWCSVVATGGFKFYYVWDILNSDVTDAIAKGIINQWCNG